MIELEGGGEERRVVEVFERETRIELAVSDRPASVTFNEHHGVLARMRLRDRDPRRLKAQSAATGREP